MSPAALDLRGIHDAALAARNHAASARALLSDDSLAAPRLDAAVVTLDRLIFDLRRDGMPA